MKTVPPRSGVFHRGFDAIEANSLGDLRRESAQRLSTHACMPLAHHPFLDVVADGETALRSVELFVRSVFRPALRDGMRFEDLLAWVLSVQWPVPMGFDLLTLRESSLARLKFGPGFGAVAKLAAPHPALPDRAVALAGRHPGCIYDPDDGGWRAPEVLDDRQWIRGGRLVLIVRCGAGPADELI
jgi:hypothetical protein